MAVRIRGGLRTLAMTSESSALAHRGLLTQLRHALKQADLSHRLEALLFDHLQHINAAIDHDDETKHLTKSTVLNIDPSVFTSKSVRLACLQTTRQAS